MNKWMKSGLGAALAVAMLAGSGNAAFAAEDFENKELSIAVLREVLVLTTGIPWWMRLSRHIRG